MKSGAVWILVVLSIAANGVLLGARWRDRTSTDSAGSPAAIGVASIETPAGDLATLGAGSTTPRRNTLVPVADPKAPVAPPPGSLWAKLDRGDLKSVVAVLRAAGMPEDDLQNIVGALIREQFKARLDAVQIGETGQPFWKTRSLGAGNAQRFAERIAIWREIESISMDLLGRQPVDPVAAQNVRRQYGPLPEEKLEALMRLDRDSIELSMQVRSGSMGPTMPWEQEQLALIEEEKRRDIEATLSPAELEMYDLHSSNTAHSLRHNLGGFSPTEAEFRALFAIQREFDTRFGASPIALSRDARRAMEEARPELAEKIKATLGEVRYADCERSTDAGFKAALAVTRRLNLPADNANATYALSRDIAVRAKAVRESTDISEANRTAALAALRDEANSGLRRLLTAAGAEAYKARSGNWLRALDTDRRRP